MKKPAARVEDLHVCPVVPPGGTPHAGGLITGPGCKTVKIEGKPAATIDDTCLCVGAINEIKSGSTGVFIEGKPAARVGDRCAHGGKIITGSRTVFIGERVIIKPLEKPAAGKEEWIEPSQAEKHKTIDQAIKDCTALLERKLKLLGQEDPETLVLFKKWFGTDDEAARQKILGRIRNALKASKELTLDNFEEILDEKERGETCAISYTTDGLHRIKVGIIFWKIGAHYKNFISGTIIHELSHFEDVGKTEDVLYGEIDCLKLAKVDPKNALVNASSFEYFVVK